MSMNLGKSFSVVFSTDGKWLATLTERAVRVVFSVDLSIHFEMRIKNPSGARFSRDNSTLLVKTTSGELWLQPVGEGIPHVSLPCGEGEGPTRSSRITT